MSGNIFTFIGSKIFLRSLLIAFLVAIVFIFLVLQWLSVYTHHGEAIAVPDLKGMSKEKMELTLHENDLHYEIVDSLFENNKKPGIILDQDPVAGSKVKRERTIYLTVNAKKPPKVKMPDLVDVSLTHAETILESYGLEVGQLIYKPDLAKNAVLAQLYRGVPIVPGKEIFKGSKIDLVLGNGTGTNDIPVPDLSNLTLGEAKTVLNGSQLELGSVKFEPGTKDTVNAKVYRQIPEAGRDNVLSQGEVVSIFLR